MHRTARPTLRVITDELDAVWGGPFVRRTVMDGRPGDALPFTGLDHPLLRKAAESFGEDQTEDTHAGTIKSVSSKTFFEIRAGQWRGAIWIDAAGVCWVVAAGLAKGGHEDRDDFYKALERREQNESMAALLPTEDDTLLWKRERASALVGEWHLDIQRALTTHLRTVATGGYVEFDVPRPAATTDSSQSSTIAHVGLKVVRYVEDDDNWEEVVIDVQEQPGWKGSRTTTGLRNTLLAVLHPPETDWDAYFGESRASFSNMLPTGTLERRVAKLSALNGQGIRALSEPTTHAHYVHRRNLALRTINGTGARSLCGVYFVPRQDHEAMPQCPECSALYAQARE